MLSIFEVRSDESSPMSSTCNNHQINILIPDRLKNSPPKMYSIDKQKTITLMTHIKFSANMAVGAPTAVSEASLKSLQW